MQSPVTFANASRLRYYFLLKKNFCTSCQLFFFGRVTHAVSAQKSESASDSKSRLDLQLINIAS